MKDYVIGRNVFFNSLTCNISSTVQEITLGSREASLLELFCKNPNEVINKTQIHESVWGAVIVNETSLTKAVSNLRKALSGFDDLTCEIKTIPKEGYIFIIDEKLDNWCIKENLLPKEASLSFSRQDKKMDAVSDELSLKNSISPVVSKSFLNLVYIVILSSLFSSVITTGLITFISHR
ncbi:winged helix-turn-helix domain-containing protein [Photorhabdus heterorhabditis]|uniref:winged helix-turn-helix domain-containing protein n=1 Tax=Photorhabdus heterorhabditis TaxID=880156 RepID=UPI001562AC6B|nr:winged helix-turn-helix domain-containing protein [Photorhabdus heterorhabditis]NRN28531.1 winged helix family transcriptional regulator [Photorhabdus heterorhabditis subsp. aluminescens]